MNPAVATANLTPNLKHAFGGILRLTLRRFTTVSHLLALAGTLAVLALLAFANRHHDGDMGWLTHVYLTFLVPMMAFMSAAGGMRDELKSSTVDYVMTRPVSRRAFVLFRYLAHLICVQIDFLPAFALAAAAGFIRDVPGLLGVLPLLFLVQLLMIVAFSAFGFLSAILTSRYVIVGLAYGGVVEVGIGQIPTQLNQLSMIRQTRDLMSSTLGGAVDPAAASAGVFSTTAVLLVFAGVLIAAAAAIFSMRELLGQNDS